MTKQSDFPIIHNDEYHTQNGIVYKWREDRQYWYPLECYLASVPTQYGCKTYEEQFEKITKLLGVNTGTKYCLHPIRYQQPMRRMIYKDGRLHREDVLNAPVSTLVRMREGFK